MSVNIKESVHRTRYRVEILLNNLVDKDVQAMFKPLNIMQLITFCPKYKIRDNFITPNCRVSKVISLIGTLAFIAILAKHISSFFIMPVTTTVLIANVIDTTIYFIGYVVNFIVCVMYSDHNLMIVLSIQDVHRILNDKSQFKSFTFWNWFILFFVNFWNIAPFVYHEFSNFSLDLEMLILMVFDCIVLYSIRILDLLESKVALWNMEVLKPRLNSNTKEYNIKMFNVFVKIFECYDLYKTSYQYLVGILRL